LFGPRQTRVVIISSLTFLDRVRVVQV